jgi:hypothetical protein
MVIEELVGTAEVKLNSNLAVGDAITNWHPIDTGGNLYCTFRKLQPTATGGRLSQATKSSPRRSTYKKLAGAKPAIACGEGCDALEISPPDFPSHFPSPAGSPMRRASLSDVRAGWPVRVVVHAIRSLTLGEADFKTDRDGEETLSLFVTAAAVSKDAANDNNSGTKGASAPPEVACTESIVFERPTGTELILHEWGHENGNELLIDMRSPAQGGAEESAGQTHVLLEVWGSSESTDGEATDFLLGMVRDLLPSVVPYSPVCLYVQARVDLSHLEATVKAGRKAWYPLRPHGMLQLELDYEVKRERFKLLVQMVSFCACR